MWEYISASSGNSGMEALIEQANELGDEGWEAFGFSANDSEDWQSFIMVFRRRKV